MKRPSGPRPRVAAVRVVEVQSFLLMGFPFLRDTKLRSARKPIGNSASACRRAARALSQMCGPAPSRTHAQFGVRRNCAVRRLRADGPATALELFRRGRSPLVSHPSVARAAAHGGRCVAHWRWVRRAARRCIPCVPVAAGAAAAGAASCASASSGASVDDSVKPNADPRPSRNSAFRRETSSLIIHLPVSRLSGPTRQSKTLSYEHGVNVHAGEPLRRPFAAFP